MATRNFVPRADNEGYIGTPTKRWAKIYGRFVKGLTEELTFSSSATLSETDVTGTIINNYGQTDNIILDLPLASAGMCFSVILGTAVSKYFRLRPNASNSIYLGGDTTGVGKYIGESSTRVGDTINFMAFQVGPSLYAWNVVIGFGDWTQEI